MADACELLGLSEEKSRVLEKYSDLFNDPSKEHSKRPGKDLRKYAKKTGKLATCYELHVLIFSRSKCCY